MRRIGKWLGRGLLLLAIIVGGLWMFGPTEVVETGISFDTPLDAKGLDAYFAAAEGKFDDLTPGTEKRVIWAGEPGVQTELSVVYVHGFSASSEETRPVADNLARALGANLVFTRLSGHGRGGAAMVGPTAGDWLRDTAEALAAARAAGQQVIVLSTSTGGTLAALAALDQEMSRNVKGMAFISPNFEIANGSAWLLTLPAARWWAPLLAGAERIYEERGERYAKFWTTRYPTVAVLPLVALVQHSAAQDYALAKVPALFVFADTDTVVRAEATRQVAARWGGDVTLMPQSPPPGNDPNNHVVAGDILSPGMTGPVTDLIVEWARGL